MARADIANKSAPESAVFSKPDQVDIILVEPLDRAGCIEQWRRTYRCSLPKHMSVAFMRKALAYEAQVKAHGGHSKAVRRALKAALKHSQRADHAIGTPEPDVASTSSEQHTDLGSVRLDQRGRAPLDQISPCPRRTKPVGKPSVLSIRAGTHLVREWNGRTYQVEALDKGFKLDG